MQLPVGQFEVNDFPRFGLPQYAGRLPRSAPKKIDVVLPDETRLNFQDITADLVRVGQTSDFHCVTGWSVAGLDWKGYAFSDFAGQVKQLYPELVSQTVGVRFRCQDGFRASLFFDDLMKPNVLLADELGGTNLDLKHGLVLRLVAPDHYGYKHAKHIKSIEFLSTMPRAATLREKLLIHQRARVANEERSMLIPRRIARYVYRPLIGPIKRKFEAALLAAEKGKAR